MSQIFKTVPTAPWPGKLRILKILELKCGSSTFSIVSFPWPETENTENTENSDNIICPEPGWPGATTRETEHTENA